MADDISPSGKSESSRRSSKGKDRSRFKFKGGKMPLALQILIIFAAFGVALLILTLVMSHLDEPAHTPPPAYGPGDQ